MSQARYGRYGMVDGGTYVDRNFQVHGKSNEHFPWHFLHVPAQHLACWRKSVLAAQSNKSSSDSEDHALGLEDILSSYQISVYSYYPSHQYVLQHLSWVWWNGMIWPSRNMSIYSHFFMVQDDKPATRGSSDKKMSRSYACSFFKSFFQFSSW